MSIFIDEHNRPKIESAIGRSMREDEEDSVETIDHFTSDDWLEITAIHRISPMTAACFMMHKLKTRNRNLPLVKECCEGALKNGKTWDEWRRLQRS